MSDPRNHRPLLDELDQRQDEVLDQLDQLNARIEVLIVEFTASRTQEQPTVRDRAA